MFKIGVIIDCFKTDIDSAIEAASRIGFDGIQVYTTKGEMAAENMDRGARNVFKNKLRSRGLELSALCGDLFKGFKNPEANPEAIIRSKRIIDLANDLETKVVTTHFGTIPEDTDSAEYHIMVDACRELGDYAAEKGVKFASETGKDQASVLKKFIEDTGSSGLAVNFDPANLTMCIDADVIDSVYVLRKYIVHTHAKDGLRGTSKPYHETPLGKGDVNWKGYLEALKDIGYDGYLTIEREAGPDRFEDISSGFAFLKKNIKSTV